MEASAKADVGMEQVSSDERGDVPVSTGVWRQEQRADAPTILKMGDL